jgi:DNA-binding transcriptional LysR family regulator
MLNLNYVYYFVQVVDKNGFSAAGKALNIPKSSLSRRISELENQLGARLIQRTSRKFVVTEVGKEFYEHSQAMLVEAEAAEQSVKRRVAEPQGAIRLTCSVPVAQFVIADLLPRFARQFPKVDIIQHATNRYVDLVDEGFDLALRAHSYPLPDSSLISRPIATTPWALFASRAYVEEHGVPTSPKDLAHHTGLHLNDVGSESRWKLYRKSREEHPINFKPRICSDDMITLKKAAESGLGIVALPAYLCRTDVRDGRLIRILPEWTARSAMITLLSPSRRGLLPSVRALSNFLVAEFASAIASDDGPA